MTGGNKTSLKNVGYTITEVMIVLAVSGVLFLIATSFVNGKQEKASFNSGVDEMASRLQGTIDQVRDGHYSDVKLTCTAGQADYDIPSAADKQGAHSECVFLGKVLHFQQGSEAKYDTLSLNGRRTDPSSTTNEPSANLSQAQPKTIDPLQSTASNPQQLEVKKILIDNTEKSYALAFVQSLNGTGSEGAQTVDAFYIDGVTSTTDAAATANAINGSIGAGAFKTFGKAKICLSDGTQYANLIIGENNNQLTVRTEKLGATQCG